MKEVRSDVQLIFIQNQNLTESMKEVQSDVRGKISLNYD